jgi:peptidoglycan/LPS O-acetylase OafA/YrhL
MTSDKVVLIGYLGVSWGALIPSAVAFWLTRTLPWRRRASILALVLAASFTPSIIILRFNGVVSAPQLIVWSSTLFVYALLVGAIVFVFIRTALRFSRPRKPH